MRSKSCCNPEQPVRATSRLPGLFLVWLIPCILLCVPNAFAGGDAPPWMHALVSAPLPAYDEKADAVLLYSETNVTVLSTDKIRTQVREAYKILRPNGREHGFVAVYFNPQRKIKSLHGWCIPAQGKDYEVKDKDAVDRALSGGGELVDDVKYRVLQLPAAEPGNIGGYDKGAGDCLSIPRIFGDSRSRIPCGRATIRCSFLPTGSSSFHGSTIRKPNRRKVGTICGG